MAHEIFGTDGIRAPVGSARMNAAFVLQLGWAAGTVLAETQGYGKVLIAKDTRVSGYMLESALEAGLIAAGMHVELLGPMPTPALAYLTSTLKTKAGIMLSASHNAYTDNGIKFFTQDGEKFDKALEHKIAEQMQKPMVTVDASALGKASRLVGASDRYIEFCKSKLSPKVRLEGLKIVVDCANGANYHIAPPVLNELGADVILMHAKPNGFNINADCGSVYPQSLQQRVIDTQADLGIAFDGDGDRVALVDAQGQLLDGDDILYILASDYHAQGRTVGTVVGTSMSNQGLQVALKALGIDFVRSAVGDRWVLEALRREGGFLGGEPSGHILQLDHLACSDGMIAALLMLDVMQRRNRTLAELKQAYQAYPSKLVNIPKPEHFDLQSTALQQAIAETEAALGATGRVVVRPSGTEPVVRILVESEDETQIDGLIQSLAAAFAS